MADVLEIVRYACPHCRSEYPTRAEAEVCAALPVPVPALRAGNVVRNGGIDDEQPFALLEWRIARYYEKHVIQWVVDGTWFHGGEYIDDPTNEEHLYVVAETPQCADCEHGIREHGGRCYRCECLKWRPKGAT